ncbi:MAG: hydroxyacid dehydrogenase [Oscillospiraceae bacterium]|nr:hydroxyacid dehydrogenase [Oscillospiraceae bacterium]
MKIALLGNSKHRFNSVFGAEAMSRLSALGDCSPLLSKGDFPAHGEFLRECEVAVATWGIPPLSADELSQWLPNLRACFYAAGTVQGFARPLLERGVRLSCAAAANAVPVAEFTFAQICLAAKGAFPAQKYYRLALPLAFQKSRGAPGNYGLKIGLLGVGAVGALVAERLKTIDARVLAYDPFLPAERAAELGLSLVSLKELFAECDVISNHLANKPELCDVLDGRLFTLMKPWAAFINTGRGAQVKEGALALALWRRPGRTALLDVLKNEVTPFLSPLWWCPNAYFTPHIAGSMGRECGRMARDMLDELERYIAGEPLIYEVTMEKLERMA